MRKLNPTVLALLGVALLLLMLWLFASRRSSDQDKLIGNVVTEQSAQSPADRRCSSKTTYDLIKRELFRRAAELRGSDQGTYDRLAGFAVLRMENAVMESEDRQSRAINCSGTLFLDLPPGVAVEGGRRSLTANIEYTLQSAEGGDVVLLRNAEAIVAPLATLARAAPVVDQPVTTNEVAPADPLSPLPPPTDAVPPAQPRPVGARPSFDCANARTRGETEVCSDAGLATLDRNMAAQYGRSIEHASPEQRRLLVQTRDRFLAFRDRCPTRACIGDVYVGRMREIRDIMEGRWEPPR